MNDRRRRRHPDRPVLRRRHRASRVCRHTRLSPPPGSRNQKHSVSSIQKTTQSVFSIDQIPSIGYFHRLFHPNLIFRFQKVLTRTDGSRRAQSALFSEERQLPTTSVDDGPTDRRTRSFDTYDEPRYRFVFKLLAVRVARRRRSRPSIDRCIHSFIRVGIRVRADATLFLPFGLRRHP